MNNNKKYSLFIIKNSRREIIVEQDVYCLWKLPGLFKSKSSPHVPFTLQDVLFQPWWWLRGVLCHPNTTASAGPSAFLAVPHWARCGFWGRCSQSSSQSTAKSKWIFPGKLGCEMLLGFFDNGKMSPFAVFPRRSPRRLPVTPFLPACN